jgi:copper(I)-binding protein
MTRLLIAPFLATVVGVWTACGPAPRGGAAHQNQALTVVDAYAAEPVTDESAVVYLTVRNGTAAADTLVGAATPIAATAGVHREMRMGGMMHMKPAGPVAVPAGGELRLEPGGTHVMLERLTRRPRAGDTIDVTLTFSHAGPISVRVPVIAYAEVSDRAAHQPR